MMEVRKRERDEGGGGEEGEEEGDEENDPD